MPILRSIVFELNQRLCRMQVCSAGLGRTLGQLPCHWAYWDSPAAPAV